MAMISCSECGNNVSDKAASCPHCGVPIAEAPQQSSKASGTYCKSCRTQVSPVVTNVGGGSCSVGKRERWKCPRCKRVLHKSGCFVATATYGDEDATEVMFLRAFRDEVLKTSSVGRLLVALYYVFSPYLARAMELFPAMQRPARRVLDVMVVAIERFTHLSRKSFRRPLP